MSTKCKIAEKEQYDELIDFLNYVYGFNGNAKDFKKLLPKLYLPDNTPTDHNYIIEENGKIRAAVGAYDNTLEVCGVTLNCRGIGNVAVHPYSRSKGYMRECMNSVLEDMCRDGIHLSSLGGRRHRYNYFGYDSTGVMYTFSINPDSMRHELGQNRVPKFTIKRVQPCDTEILDRIYDLNISGDFKTLRNRENLFSILTSWQAELYAAFCGEDFVGYVVKDGENLSEIGLCRDEDILDLLASLYDSISATKLVIYVPPFKTEYIKRLYRFSEWYGVTAPMFFNVLDYKTVLYAFLKLKSTYASLPNGKLNILIHGYSKDESLSIQVSNGDISVTDSEENPSYEIEHINAMGLFFGNISPEREALPSFARLWFPLPLWQYRADEV